MKNRTSPQSILAALGPALLTLFSRGGTAALGDAGAGARAHVARHPQTSFSSSLTHVRPMGDAGLRFAPPPFIAPFIAPFVAPYVAFGAAENPAFEQDFQADMEHFHQLAMRDVG